MKVIKKTLVLTAFYCSSSYGLSFNDALSRISNHEVLKSSQDEIQASYQLARSSGSLNDPMFKLGFKNYPVETLEFDQSPMTGIDYGLSQTFPLSKKLGNLEESITQQAKAMELQTLQKERELQKALWGLLLEKRKDEVLLGIYKENAKLLNEMTKVSNELYSNGSLSQSSLLELEIRKSDVQALLSNTKFNIERVNSDMSYLIGSNENIELSTVPFKSLKVNTSNVEDYSELALKRIKESKLYNYKAKKSDVIPDLTVGLVYTQRSDIDNNGDFITLSFSLPIPVMGKKHGLVDSSYYQKEAAGINLNNYRKQKTSNLNGLQSRINAFDQELKLVKNSLDYAGNLRLIASKSYNSGDVSYLDYIKAQMNLLSLQVRKENLVFNKDKAIVDYKFIRGEALNGH